MFNITLIAVWKSGLYCRRETTNGRIGRSREVHTFGMYHLPQTFYNESHHVPLFNLEDSEVRVARL